MQYRKRPRCTSTVRHKQSLISSIANWNSTQASQPYSTSENDTSNCSQAYYLLFMKININFKMALSPSWRVGWKIQQSSNNYRMCTSKGQDRYYETDKRCSWKFQKTYSHDRARAASCENTFQLSETTKFEVTDRTDRQDTDKQQCNKNRNFQRTSTAF